MKFSNAVYDSLKAAAQIWIPALGTLYFTLAAIWGLPHADQIVGSITAIDTALGVVLGISSTAYKPATDGNLVVDRSSPIKDVYSLELNVPPSELANKSSLVLEVTPKASKNLCFVVNEPSTPEPAKPKNCTCGDLTLEKGYWVRIYDPACPEHR